MAKKVATHQITEKECRQFKSRLASIRIAQDFILSNLVGQTRFYFYQDGSAVNWLEVRFQKNNFMHLCGVTYLGGPHRFWEDLLNQRLSFESIRLKNDGYSLQKLQIISEVSQLNSPDLMITGRQIFLNLKYDHLIRTKKAIMAIALTQFDDYYKPISLLNLQNQSGKLTQVLDHGHPIIAILDKNIETGIVKDTYNASKYVKYID